MTKLLIIDDDKALLTMLTRHFEMQHFEILTAENGVDALEKLGSRPDLILLDVNMPRMDGLHLCRMIRDKVACPILFLTAKVEEEDRVNGLLSGGDDYITKPFSLKELDARITAHLKREQRHAAPPDCRFQSGLIIDYGAKTVQLDGNCLDLTKTEYGIIEFLSMHPGIVFDRERIYERVCGWDAEGDSRVITELIRRIRNKLRALTETEYIETVWGMGYRWVK
ncbi:MAG: response regulator transcription factor [Butyrivibrio sp.]|nr:response regulator transcription factor [Acetatifactor muris]MCM1559525.1 response regulator transcription factor [Butyrivibrio sp.]